MQDPYSNFQSRLKKLARKHSAMAHGFATVMRPDGLIVVQPKRRRAPGIPLRGLTYLLIGFFVFKGFMLSSLGPATYEDRLGRLQDGTVIEQAGAWVMQIDPLTLMLSQMIGPILR